MCHSPLCLRLGGLCSVDKLLEDGSHSGLSLVGCFLHLLVAHLNHNALETKVGDYRYTEYLDAAMACYDYLGYC